MAFDLRLMGEKLKRYRDQFQVSLEDVSNHTGISKTALENYESGEGRPSGDEILILAEYYKCDYKFFLSNEKLTSFEQTETLFRKHGSDFSSKDRWSVQECLFMAECESHLLDRLGKCVIDNSFEYKKVGSRFKSHGKDAAEKLRQHLGYGDKEVSMNIYDDLRQIGVKVFRRKLENSSISGLYIEHPVVGSCVLINCSEDIYRQRFTAAHEMAHTILDKDKDVLVSFVGDRNLVEVRANTFASAYLMPPKVLLKIPKVDIWSEQKAIVWASKFKVSTHALAIALSENGFIDDSMYKLITNVRVPIDDKIDPELRDDLPVRLRNRKKALLELGLSEYYVSLCFEAYRAECVSALRLVEMLLLESAHELGVLAEIYGERLRYAS